MARKNRISVPNGIYHVTTRIAHGAMLLKSDAVKERVVSAMYKTAAFSGVELYAWCVMDNHIHMLVHVPNVPKQYRVNPDIDPPSYAFGMRPAECRIPIWSKDDDVPITALPRPPLEFKLPDEELLRRIRILYDAKTAEKKLNSWNAAIATGASYVVEEEKERYFRRMYNISQFMKTFKERVTKMFNEDYGHKGALWQGRFYSGLVENISQVLSIVAAYIDYNPVKDNIISYKDFKGEVDEHWFGQNLRNVLNVEFDDIEEEFTDTQYGRALGITDKTALEIKNFIDTMYKLGVKNWYIHCRSGRSRSVAVGIYLIEYLLIHNEDYQDNDFKKDKANKRVLSLVREPYGNKGKN